MEPDSDATMVQATSPKAMWKKSNRPDRTSQVAKQITNVRQKGTILLVRRDWAGERLCLTVETSGGDRLSTLTVYGLQFGDRVDRLIISVASRPENYSSIVTLKRELILQ